jgi:hypothetical protein
MSVETKESLASQANPVAHVTVQIDDGDPIPKEVPAGNTQVLLLKAELGVAADSVLWLVHGQVRKPYDNSETIDVANGMHFEAIGGGGIS